MRASASARNWQTGSTGRTAARQAPIQVMIVSPKLNSDGMVYYFAFVKDIICKYDHQYLTAFFMPSTTEKFAEILLEEVQAAVPPPGVQVIEVGVR
jgi:6-pyruvoyl-tetrahydropterin synthase